jgi:chaperonin cofactor prefoldin
MQDIEVKAAFSQQQLPIVKAQIAGKQRDIRLLQLTTKELNSLPSKTSVYEGVGKMFVIPCSYFKRKPKLSFFLLWRTGSYEKT